MLITHLFPSHHSQFHASPSNMRGPQDFLLLSPPTCLPCPRMFYVSPSQGSQHGPSARFCSETSPCSEPFPLKHCDAFMMCTWEAKQGQMHIQARNTDRPAPAKLHASEPWTGPPKQSKCSLLCDTNHTKRLWGNFLLCTHFKNSNSRV